MQILKSFTEQDMQAFEPDAKLGIIGTVSPDGLPHLTLITALMAKNPQELYWGQFSEGNSKKNVKQNPKTGFCIMTLDKSFWRGKANWTHEEKSGEDYDMFNKKPMFRYNAYFGIHTIHYMDLVETYGKENLPMVSVVVAAVQTMVLKGFYKTGIDEKILQPFANGLFADLQAPKFLGYIGKDGYPVVIPVIQTMTADSRRLVFSTFAFKDELEQIPPGTKVAIYCVNLTMENVLIRGTLSAYKSFPLMKLGIVDIEWVYNSMPPTQRQIYPKVELKPVTNF